MKEYNLMLAAWKQKADDFAYSQKAFQQQILFVEAMLAAMEDLQHRVESLEKQSPYDTPEDDYSTLKQLKDLKKRLETIEFR